MAYIKVCDICGKTLLAAQYEIERKGFINKTYDVCPACMNKMTEWIKANAESEDKE